MGQFRLKLSKGLSNFVPVSVNFSSLEKEFTNQEEIANPGDHGLESSRLENNLAYEELVVQILCNLDAREKLVFIYQLLRDDGYQIDHSSFAKTINLSRSQYMKTLDLVRTKASLFVLAYRKNSESKDTNNPETL